MTCTHALLRAVSRAQNWTVGGWAGGCQNAVTHPFVMAPGPDQSPDTSPCMSHRDSVRSRFKAPVKVGLTKHCPVCKRMAHLTLAWAPRSPPAFAQGPPVGCRRAWAVAKRPLTLVTATREEELISTAVRGCERNRARGPTGTAAGPAGRACMRGCLAAPERPGTWMVEQLGHGEQVPRTRRFVHERAPRLTRGLPRHSRAEPGCRAWQGHPGHR